MCVCRGAGLWLFSGARGGQFSFGSFTASVAAVALLFHSDTSLCPFLCVTISVSPFGPVCHLSPTPLFLAFKAFLFPPTDRSLPFCSRKKSDRAWAVVHKAPSAHSLRHDYCSASRLNQRIFPSEREAFHSFGGGEGGSSQKKKNSFNKSLVQ